MLRQSSERRQNRNACGIRKSAEVVTGLQRLAVQVATLYSYIAFFMFRIIYIKGNNTIFEIILLAFAIFMILEGLGPLLIPKTWQNYLKTISEQDPESIRRLGGVFVVIGICTLYWFL